MKYILNESPIRTTNGFRVNNVAVDLNIPLNMNFSDYKSNIEITSNIKDSFSSNIGLNHDIYKNSIINLDKDYNDLIVIEYNFIDNNHLVDNLDINIHENKNINMLLKYSCLDNNEYFHNGNININMKNNSSLNLTIFNDINKNSINLLSGNITTSYNSNVVINLIDLTGKIRIYNFKSITKKNSSSTLNNIYIGRNNDLIDLNYNYINDEEFSNNNIEVQGVLDNNATKTFKGTIDFKEKSFKSTGHENENCLLLSKTCISKSLPILLCHEEDVDGAHSVSSGKIDQNKLFYLMSRGLTENESKQLIIKSNFNHILNIIPDEIRDSVIDKIDDIL